jgi:hypothetical protein
MNCQETDETIQWCWYDAMDTSPEDRRAYGPYGSRKAAEDDAYGGNIFVAPVLYVELDNYIANSITPEDILDNANALLDDEFMDGTVDRISIDPKRLQAAAITLDRVLRDWAEKYCCIAPLVWVPDPERAIHLGERSLDDCSGCPSKGDCGGCPSAEPEAEECCEGVCKDNENN